MEKTSSESNIQRSNGKQKFTKKMVEDIDLQALAEEVYKLFKKELKTERDRKGRI